MTESHPPEKLSKLQERAQKFLHIYEYFIGIIIILKGIEELPHFHHHPFSVGFIFFAGAFIFFGATFHHYFEKFLRKPQGVFHIMEGLVEIVTAFILFQGSKRMIPYFLFFIGLMYLSTGIIEHYQTPENKERLMQKFCFWMGIAIIGFACGISIFNAFTAKQIAPYIVSALMFLMGLFLIYLKSKGFDPNSKFYKKFYSNIK